jgi:23S rRNA U2552 (ribose-2'-O)-methylase RlmE/FtsJ
MFPLLGKSNLVLKHNPNKPPNLQLSYIDTIEPIDDFKELCRITNEYKCQIDNLKSQVVWDFYKKLSNDYELLHQTLKKKNINIGIANYDPISRSFFKLWEIIQDFNLIDNNRKTYNFLGLAEGPGGFIECFNYYRRRYCKDNNDRIFGMTLKSTKVEVPGWKKSQRVINECKEIQIVYGIDNTGNLYNPDNIEFLKDTINDGTKNEKIDIATADGGFDFSNDYTNQELMMIRLLYCEIIGAFSTLKVGGHFVLKVFDLFHKPSLDLLNYLTYFFNEVIITKPYSSRPANSEKYIVCKGFKGIESELLGGLIRMMGDFREDGQIASFFDGKLDQEFINCIVAYETYHSVKQIKNIMKTLLYIEIGLDNESINEIKKNQVASGYLWCKKYDFPISLRCRYLISNENNNYNFIPFYS